MKRAMWLALVTGALISSAAAIGIGASSFFVPQSLSRAQFATALAAIDSQREQVLARCEARAAPEREVCRAEAGADELVRMADSRRRAPRARGPVRQPLLTNAVP